MQAFGPCTAVAVQPAATLKTGVRFPLAGGQGGLQGGDALPAAQGGTGDGARCCRCIVPGALPFWSPQRTLTDMKNIGIRYTLDKEKLRGRDTPPIHRRYRWWSGLLKGAVAGTSPTGPWTDRRTGVRTPDHDECQPRRIPLDRPCLLPTMTLRSLIRRLPWGWGNAP